MNIAYVLQHSVYDNNGKWNTRDSNIQMMRGMLTEVLKQRDDWNFYVLIAPLKDFADITTYDTIFKHERVHFIPMNFPVDAFMNRYNFNVSEVKAIWSQLPKDVDILWNNITEHSRNWKTFLHFNSPKTKLVTCCYWMDLPQLDQEKIDKSMSYDFRQIDGYECSDLCVFTCPSVMDAFFNNAKLKVSVDVVNRIHDKSVIWDFGYSQAELDSYIRSHKITPFQTATIIFLNRLSGINYTHHKEFIDGVNKLWEKRQDFQVIMANPSTKVSWEELQKECKPLYVYKESLSRDEYIELLWKSDISVHLFQIEHYGGCSHREALHCDNVVITTKVNEYLNIQGEDYPYYVNDKLDNLAEVLDRALDAQLDFNHKYDYDQVRNENMKSSFEYISKKVISDIEGLLS